MARVTDLYPILKAYALKNNSPYIDIDTFLDFLKKLALHKVQEQPDWKKWLANTGLQFWSELSTLVDRDQCVLLAVSSGGQIYMPHYYIEMLEEIYRDIDKTAHLPFPSEETMGMTLPEHQQKIVNLKTDLGPLIEKERKEENDEIPVAGEANQKQIIKIIFPEDGGSALILASFIPRRFLEAAFLKLRHYLQIKGNKEYILHKLVPQLQNKEDFLSDMLDQVIIRPIECLNAMEKSGDFSYLFWTCLCGQVKGDIKKKTDIQSSDLAAIQAAHIIELCNGIYKTRAVKKREREVAFRNLEQSMGTPPFHFSKDEILKFHTDKGLPLLGMYSTAELEDYIARKTTSTNGNELPEWLTIKGGNGQLWYFKKERYLSICVKMLIDTSVSVKKAITKRWVKSLREFRKESAMYKEADFENLLRSFTLKLSPPLSAILNDEKLLHAYEETERTQGMVSPSLRIFKAGKLLPLSTLYSIRRKDVLTDAKILLPFWYSIPVLTAIIAFFKGLSKKNGKKQSSEPIEAEEQLEGKAKALVEIQTTANEVTETIVPKGKTLDAYLEDLESRWNKQIGHESHKNLTTDIQSLARDDLRQMLKVHKSKRITRESIEAAAGHLIARSHALSKLSSKDALHLYIQLYMAKMLLRIKGNSELL